MPERNLHRPIQLAILAAVVTIVLKGAAYAVTGSVGLLSDAAETGINLLAAGTAYFSLWYAAQPVDREHTYGHQKIEFFSSGLEGGLILLAAVGIAWYAVQRLLAPEPLHALDVGVLMTAAATALNLAAGWLLLRVGRAEQSIVLEAHGHHLLTDVWTSAGVLLGLAVIWTARTGWQVELLWMDPVIGLLVAGNITWTGFRLVRRSFDGLMDHALPPEEQALVRGAIEAQLEPGMDYHALRTRQAGARRFADCHLLVPGQLTVLQAHQVADRIERAVKQALPHLEMTVHIEPIEERGAWEDSALLPLEQADRERGQR